MKTYNINTVKDIKLFLRSCKEKGWTLFQYQYNWNDTNGFHAWYCKGDRIIQVITRNKEVQNKIVGIK